MQQRRDQRDAAIVEPEREEIDQDRHDHRAGDRRKPDDRQRHVEHVVDTGQEAGQARHQREQRRWVQLGLSYQEREVQPGRLVGIRAGDVEAPARWHALDEQRPPDPTRLELVEGLAEQRHDVVLMKTQADCE